MQVQWYPGHMAKAKRMLKEQLKLVDLVIEVLDARIPKSSSNPDLTKLVGDKPRLIVLNKADLSDAQETVKWIDFYRSHNIMAIKMNSTRRQGIDTLVTVVNNLVKPKLEQLKKKGFIFRPARAMVVGIPNVGKSSLINNLVRKGSAKTGDKPGVTKGKQWIRVLQNLELLDTPGLLWPKFEDSQVGLNLALTGAISEQVYDVTEIAIEMLKLLKNDYSHALKNRYKLEDLVDDNYSLLEDIGRKRGLLRAGGIVEVEKAAIMILHDFRQAKLGNITLEKVCNQ